SRRGQRRRDADNRSKTTTGRAAVKLIRKIKRWAGEPCSHHVVDVRHVRHGDRADRARDDDTSSDRELDAESGVHAAHLEEAAAECAAGEADARELWKELAAAHEHFAGGRRDDHNFISAVLGQYGEPV